MSQTTSDTWRSYHTTKQPSTISQSSWETLRSHSTRTTDSPPSTSIPYDPLGLSRLKRDHTSEAEIAHEYPKTRSAKAIKKYYTHQNGLIDGYLHIDDISETAKYYNSNHGRSKVEVATYTSSIINFIIFVVQLYAAIKTGSLILAAGAADSFLDTVSSIVMVVIAALARKPRCAAYPVGRARTETVGLLMFCCLVMNVAFQLIIEASRRLATHGHPFRELKYVPLLCLTIAASLEGALTIYLYFNRDLPITHILFISTRNDLLITIFSLVATGLASHTPWYFDPAGALVLAFFILISWWRHAIAHAKQLIGEAAPPDLISRVLYVGTTYDEDIKDVRSLKAYHAGEKCIVEIDVVLHGDGISISEICRIEKGLKQRIEGLKEVERAFVNVVTEEYREPKHDGDVLELEEPKSLLRRLRHIVCRCTRKLLRRGDDEGHQKAAELTENAV